MFKVLVVDDEKQARETMLDALSRNFGRELEFYEAEDGLNAVCIALLRRVDLVLMDIFMPGMSGMAAAKNIKKQLPGIKIIFVTAYDRFEYAQDALRLGASDYILKPFREKVLTAAVRQALDQSEAGPGYAESSSPVISAPECGEEPDDTYDPQMAQLIQHMREYMNRNYMNTISLDYLSEILNISPSYLSTQFKRYASINFVDYLTDLRINEATRLLMDPLRSTAEVASLVGYSDGSYFARVFKKRTGLTPTQYRRQRLRHSDEKDSP